MKGPFTLRSPNKTKVLLLQLLPSSYTEIRNALGISDPAVQRHLKELTQAGLITKNQEGKYVLTDRGKTELELELQRDRVELELRSEDEDLYRTNWLFRDFVHTDLAPQKSSVKNMFKLVATLGMSAIYRDIFQPAFKPSEAERDYANFLMILYIDSVNYERLFDKHPRLESLVRMYPNYKRVIAKSMWSVTTSFQDEYFDYKSIFTRSDVQTLMTRSFVSILESNYLEVLQRECSETVGRPITLTREDFIKIICWMRLKERSLPIKTYDRFREYLLRIALIDLGLVDANLLK